MDGSSYKTVAQIITKNGQILQVNVNCVDHFIETIEKTQIKQGKTLDQFIPINFDYKTQNSQITQKIVNIILLSATVAIAYLMIKQTTVSLQKLGQGGGGMGGGQDIFNMGKSKVKVFGLDSKINTKFIDVAGLDEAKYEVQEFVDFLKSPKKYSDIGAKIPKGALLSGPPGTGKTLLAKACAGEAGVPFFFMSGSDFVEMFVGVGASRVRDLFTQAKQKSPSIIFIDEIDAVGRKRENQSGRGNDERDNTLNQLLVEMDGFGTDSKVIVMAATNRKELLDSALTRPGRFDRIIDITLPDIEGRKQIFSVHLKPLKIQKGLTIEELSNRLATLTPGFSGAEIANLCNEAAILAARKNKSVVETLEFEEASDRVMAGLEKKSIISLEDKKVVAVHESGHAVVGWFLEGQYPLLKLTIVPRAKGTLGFAQYLPNEGSLQSKEEILDRVCSILGGRCAEKLFLGKISTGAVDDLKKVYETVHSMITKLGMSDVIGYQSYQDNQYRKSYSDQTNRNIDNEVQRIILQQTERANQLVLKYKDKINQLSEALIEKNTLDLKQLTQILGERPYPPKSNFKAYLEIHKQINNEELSKQQAQAESKNNEQSQQNGKPILQKNQSNSQDHSTQQQQQKSEISKTEQKDAHNNNNKENDNDNNTKK